MDRDTFITKAIEVHGDKYDYSLADYGRDGRSERTTIICPVHGEFTQRPKNHLAGRGCNACSVDAQAAAKVEKGAAAFVERAMAVHGARYDYSQIVYKGSQSKLSIICKKHGPFSITPNNHIWGKGCRQCYLESTLIPFDEFVSRATELHNGKYDYSEVKIVNYSKRVKILCKHHGQFEQSYLSHIAGDGCPGCAKTGYDSTKPGTLYVLELGSITKIGITHREVPVRVAQIKKNSGKDFNILTQFNFDNGRIPPKLETLLLRELRAAYEQPTEKYDGSTESFLDVDVQTLLARIRQLAEEHA